MDPQSAPATAAAGCPMHDAAFAADPQQVYDRLRAHGPAGPVELAPGVEATLVVGHETALRVLQNSTLFARDARRWKALNEGRIPLDHPVLPMMAYRPNCLFTDGAVHLRLRKAVTDSLARLNITRIRRDVEPIADYLIDQFSERGRADLLNDYAKLLPLLLFNKLFGCPADIGDTLTGAMSAIFDGKDALRANEELTSCLMELIALKRRRPGDDVTSWLIQHPAGLTDEELKDQLVMLMGSRRGTRAQPDRQRPAPAAVPRRERTRLRDADRGGDRPRAVEPDAHRQLRHPLPGPGRGPRGSGGRGGHAGRHQLRRRQHRPGPGRGPPHPQQGRPPGLG